MEKRKPHYALTDIKAAFADPATLNRSFVSTQGADALRMDDAAVVAVIQALATADFDKSMTSMLIIEFGRTSTDPKRLTPTCT